MRALSRLLAILSDLRLAIVLLLLIAAASAVGTILPQQEAPELYLERFNSDPWLGVINGDQMLAFQLDHLYSSVWFLILLAWLGVALMLCSWRRQWPALQAAMRWIDYTRPRQLSKLAIALLDIPRVNIKRQFLLLRLLCHVACCGCVPW